MYKCDSAEKVHWLVFNPWSIIVLSINQSVLYDVFALSAKGENKFASPTLRIPNRGLVETYKGLCDLLPTIGQKR